MFRRMLFSNVAAMGGTAPAAIVTETVSHEEFTADATQYTSSALGIGTASATRYVLAGLVARHATITPNVTGITIGGVSATACGAAVEQETGTTQAFFIAAVPTGTTAVVVVDWDQTVLRMGLTLWALTGLQSTTPTNVYADTSLASNAYSVSIDVTANGAAYAIAQCNSALTTTWAGLTEDHESALELFNNSAAHADFATTQTGLTVSATLSGAGSATGGMRVIALR